MTQNIYGIYRNVTALIPERIHPTSLKLCKDRSLQVQGLGVWTTGFNLRPSYSDQRQVFQLVMKYISIQQSHPDDDTFFPEELCSDHFPFLNPVDIDPITHWDWRCKQSLSKMKMFQTCRKVSTDSHHETLWLKETCVDRRFLIRDGSVSSENKGSPLVPSGGGWPIRGREKALIQVKGYYKLPRYFFP